MSKVPFYADADALSKRGTWAREFCVFLFYLSLCIFSSRILIKADEVENVFVKIITALFLIGLPTQIAFHMKRKIDSYADEFLKAEYNNAATTSGISFMAMALMWILFDRWGSPVLVNSIPNIGDSFPQIADLVIFLGPYMMILGVYSSVRRKMMTLSGDGK